MASSRVPRDPTISPETRRFLDDISLELDGLTPDSIGAAGVTQVEYLPGIIVAPTNKDYRIVEKAPYGFTLTGFTAKTASGTITATLKINSTAVTTGAINVTSSQASVTPTAANVAVADDALVLTTSSNSSAVDLSFVVKYTRTLAS